MLYRDIDKALDWLLSDLKSRCNKHDNNMCNTHRCIRMGGTCKDSKGNWLATCEEDQAIQAIEYIQAFGYGDDLSKC